MSTAHLLIIAVAAVAALFVIAAAAIEITKPWRQPHQHSPRPVAVSWPSGLPVAITGLPQTIVLMRCPCGVPSTVTLSGHWDMTELQDALP